MVEELPNLIYWTLMLHYLSAVRLGDLQPSDSVFERRGVVFFRLESSSCCLNAWCYLGLYHLVSDPLATLGK